MAQTMTNARVSDPVRSLDNIRPTAVKAGLASDRVGPAFGAAFLDAVIRHYGSVKAAAISLQVDPSLMVREFKKGKVGRFEHADADAKAYVAAALHEAYGAYDPKVRRQRLIRDLRSIADELSEVI